MRIHSARASAFAQASSNRIARIVENWLRCFVSFPLSLLYPHLSPLRGKALIYLFRSFSPYLPACSTPSPQIFVTFSLTYEGRVVASWRRIKKEDRDRGEEEEEKNRKLPRGIIKYAPRGNSYLSLESIIVHVVPHAFLSFSFIDWLSKVLAPSLFSRPPSSFISFSSPFRSVRREL